MSLRRVKTEPPTGYEADQPSRLGRRLGLLGLLAAAAGTAVYAVRRQQEQDEADDIGNVRDLTA